jgi:competence ComEA-like helix-hairpin-helix protein
MAYLGDGFYIECEYYGPADDGGYVEKLDLNTATEMELGGLHGMGPTKARMIVLARESRGGFKDVSELLGLRCIGKGTYDKLVKQVYIGEKSEAEKEIERLREEKARLEDELEKERQGRWLEKLNRAQEVVGSEIRSRFGESVRLFRFEHVDSSGYWFSFELAGDATRQTWCVKHEEV